MKAFVAYPAEPSFVAATIEVATQRASTLRGAYQFQTWRELDIPGRFIAEQVLEAIDNADCLIADVTILNFNVLFELGYAIGRGTRVVVIRNKAVTLDADAQELGIIDTLGYKDYTNSDELASYLSRLEDVTPIPLPKIRSATAPVYLNQGRFRIDPEARIISIVKKLGLKFRSFDPNETPRLSAFDAIAEVFQSSGVVVHLIANEMAGARVHNLRGAFIAGLAEGADIATCLIQSGRSPVPLDVRDFVHFCEHPNHYKDVLTDFAPVVLDALQAGVPRFPLATRGRLARLSMGASSAENEMTDLGAYYLDTTDAYQRASRKEVRLITGRKGSGKTAIFFQLRDRIRRDRANVVLDLKPDGYQLRKFRDSVLSLMAAGTVEHVLTAFWEYLLLLEICYKLLEKDQEVHKRDHRLTQPYNDLRAAYEVDEFVREGDFAERLTHLLRNITQEYGAQHGREEEGRLVLDADAVTGLIYHHDVAALRKRVQSYLQYKKELWLLFDNVDKGWPTEGLRSQDLVIIRTLVEATRKIERELTQKGIDAHTVIFLRNDVYELLLQQTPDRGKETRANVDWTDTDSLKELLRRRIVFSLQLAADTPFDRIWHELCVPFIDGEESARYLIERSLMRPRCLIDLINQCKGFAVNLGHERVDEDDIRKGLSAYSSGLLTEIGLEVHDVLPNANEILYAFIQCPATLTLKSVRDRLRDFGVADDNLDRLTETLLWFGFLGVMWGDGNVKFIYSVNYDMKLIRGYLKGRDPGDVTVQINPAFWSGLAIEPNDV